MSLKKLASLIVKITANGAQAQAELRTLEKKVGDFGKSMKRVGQNMTKYVTLPLAAIATASVAAANTQLQAEAKLLTALKGRKDVQERLMRQASELQSRSLFGDEAIIEQQAFLAALGLSEEQITTTIEAAVQLSTALGMDLTSAVKNLAKTYSGMTGELGESIPALKNFTKEQLKAGDAIGYVNANYKGFAESAAGTGTGSLTQLQNKLGDLAEKIGTTLIPILDKLVVVLDKFVTVLSSLPEGAQTAAVGLGLFLAAIGPILAGLNSMLTLITGVIGKLGSLSTAASGTASSLAPIIAALGALFSLPVATGLEVTNTVNEGLAKRYKNVYDKNFAIYANDIIDQATLAGALTQAWEEYKKAEEAWKMSGEKVMSAEMWAVRDAAAKFEAIKAAYKQRFMGESTSPVVAEDVVAANNELDRELGIIERLEQRLAKLREQQAQAMDLAQLDKVNTEIKLISDELERLRNFSAEDFNQMQEQMSFKGIAMRPVRWGDVEMKGDFALEWGPLSQRNFEEWRKAQLERAERMVETVREMNAILTEALVNFAETSFDMLADLFTGQEIKPLATFLEMIGNLLKQLGKALIAYGGLIEAFRETWSNPWISIAVGAAAIAAGAAFTALAKRPFAQNTVKLANGGLAYGPTMAVVGDNPGAANDPEVIAPLSKLRNYMGGQKLELTGEIEWEMRGDVLRAVLDRNNIRLATLA